MTRYGREELLRIRIRNAAKKLGSQAELARRAKVNRQSVCNFLAGRRSIAVVTHNKLLNYLDQLERTQSVAQPGEFGFQANGGERRTQTPVKFVVNSKERSTLAKLAAEAGKPLGTYCRDKALESASIGAEEEAGYRTESV